MTPDAFRKLALAEIDAVYRLAYHLAPRPDLADDYVQETYLRAFRAKTDFQLNDFGVRPYLFKILHNVIHSAFAREARQPGLLDNVEDLHTQSTDRVSGSVDLEHLDWDAMDERLKQAVQALPLAHRTVFLLCAVENMKYREIAEIVEIPLGTVMSRLHSARQQLLKQLTGLATEQRLGRSVQRDKVD